MLTLPIKRQWYDMILCGQKREEYREDNPYYRSRFEKLFDLSPEALADPVRQKASVLRLRNGYNAAADTMEITAVLQHGEGRPGVGRRTRKALLHSPHPVCKKRLNAERKITYEPPQKQD